MTKRGCKYCFYPTPEQANRLARAFGCVRFVYNAVLRWRTDAFFKEQQMVGYTQASARLTALRKLPETAFLNEASSAPLQQPLCHHQAAFKNFFEGRAKYPASKKRHRQSAELTSSVFRHRDGKLFLAKCDEPLAIRWSRLLPCEPSTVTPPVFAFV